LVEPYLAKVAVASSSLVSRSTFYWIVWSGSVLYLPELRTIRSVRLRCGAGSVLSRTCPPFSLRTIRSFRQRCGAGSVLSRTCPLFSLRTIRSFRLRCGAGSVLSRTCPLFSLRTIRSFRLRCGAGNLPAFFSKNHSIIPSEVWSVLSRSPHSS
jgi:hypothetical protein